jgi:hypothetical protein
VIARAACHAHLRSGTFARIYGRIRYDIRARSQACAKWSVQFDDEDGTRSNMIGSANEPA